MGTIKDVSIIIPIYNAEESLHRCLDSVLNQDFRNWECILVDDGSKDKSVNIIDEYQKKDSRFIAIHSVNKGVSSARNIGISKAQGSWIVFIDADDWIKENHLSDMFRASSHEVDLVVTGFEFIHPNFVSYNDYQNRKYLGLSQVKQFICSDIFLKYQVPWDRMYRASIIKKKGLRFDERLSLSEDRLFNYNYLYHTKCIATNSNRTYVHDGTDISTLSYKIPNIDKQVLRYKKMLQAINRLISKFDINKKEALNLEKYVFSILDYAIHTPCRVIDKIRIIIELSFFNFPFFCRFFLSKVNKYV